MKKIPHFLLGFIASLTACSSPVDIEAIKAEVRGELLQDMQAKAKPSPTSIPEPTPMPAVVNGQTVEFRDFIPGKSSFEDVKKTLQQNTSEYKQIDFPNAFTIRSLTTISGAEVMVNFYFHDNILAIVDVMFDYRYDPRFVVVQSFLNAKYGPREVRGYYKYPNIKVDYTILCYIWGSKASDGMSCSDEPIIEDDEYSEVSRRLNIPHIKDVRFTVIGHSFVYQSPEWAMAFKKRQYAAKDAQDKIKEAQANQNIINELEGEL